MCQWKYIGNRIIDGHNEYYGFFNFFIKIFLKVKIDLILFLNLYWPINICFSYQFRFDYKKKWSVKNILFRIWSGTGIERNYYRGCWSFFILVDGGKRHFISGGKCLYGQQYKNIYSNLRTLQTISLQNARSFSVVFIDNNRTHAFVVRTTTYILPTFVCHRILL